MDEYAVENLTDGNPEFAWWVPYTPKRRNRIISKVRTKYWRKTHKYGVRLPNNLKESIHIDQENGNTYRNNVIYKEMNKSNISYKPR